MKKATIRNLVGCKAYIRGFAAALLVLAAAGAATGSPEVRPKANWCPGDDKVGSVRAGSRPAPRRAQSSVAKKENKRSAIEPSPSHQQKEAAMKLLLATREKTERLQTVRARFVQTKNLSMLSEPVVSNGVFLYKKGGKFVWHYLPPDESVTVCDGSRVWLYFPALCQAQVYDVQRFKKRSRAFEKLCLGFERPLCDLTDSFSVELIGETETDFWVSLRPREESLARLVSEIRILIDKGSGLPLQLHSLERDGDETKIVFEETEVNPSLDDAHFVFVPPDNVKVDEAQPSLSY